MAEIVSSAVVQETVSHILSGLVEKYEDKQDSSASRNLERLEMAHIRLEAALEISDKWQITNASLLRWRKKLKHVARECDDMLLKCKQRILEDEEKEQEVRDSSLPKRIVHATKSFVFSVFNHEHNELSRSVVQRFEWLADGASEFLRLVELGGTPQYHVPFAPLMRHLLAGKKLHYRINRQNKCHLFLHLAPFFTAEHGIEARLMFMQKHDDVPEDEFFLSLVLQFSESTDIFGIAIKSLALFAPLFKSTVETIRKELMQIQTQDFSWVPYVDSHQKEHWDNLHSFGTQWFRPNPLCCKQYDQHNLCLGSKLDKSGLPDVSLEPVIAVGLQCQILLSECNKQRASLSECKNSIQDSPYLRAGLLFTPHGISVSEDMPCSNTTSAIYGEEQHYLHTDFTLEQLEAITLPKAINYFRQNDGATVYKMLWRSKHGAAYIQVEKACIFMPSTRKMLPGARKRKVLQQQDVELGSWTHGIFYFLSLWALHSPFKLQGLIKDWFQTEQEKQLAPHRYHLKF